MLLLDNSNFARPSSSTFSSFSDDSEEFVPSSPTLNGFDLDMMDMSMEMGMDQNQNYDPYYEQQHQQVLGVSSELIEPTKLTAKQIKHALPSWMFNDIVDDPLPDKRTPKKTRRGCRAKKNKDKANHNRMAMENDVTMVGDGSISLSKCISSLPAELQRCFTEWRRERKQAIITSDMERQKNIETVMWSALRNIMSSQREKENHHHHHHHHQAHYYYY